MGKLSLDDALTLQDKLDIADTALSNAPEVNESVDSAIQAARSAINSARAGIKSI